MNWSEVNVIGRGEGGFVVIRRSRLLLDIRSSRSFRDDGSILRQLNILLDVGFA